MMGPHVGFFRDVFWKHVQIWGNCASAMTTLTGLELSRPVMAVAPLAVLSYDLVVTADSHVTQTAAAY